MQEELLQVEREATQELERRKAVKQAEAQRRREESELKQAQRAKAKEGDCIIRRLTCGRVNCLYTAIGVGRSSCYVAACYCMMSCLVVILWCQTSVLLSGCLSCWCQTSVLLSDCLACSPDAEVKGREYMRYIRKKVGSQAPLYMRNEVIVEYTPYLVIHPCIPSSCA